MSPNKKAQFLRKIIDEDYLHNTLLKILENDESRMHDAEWVDPKKAKAKKLVTKVVVNPITKEEKPK